MNTTPLHIEEVIHAEKIFATQFDGTNGRDIKTLLEGNEIIAPTRVRLGGGWIKIVDERDRSFTLKKGDWVIWYTDGVEHTVPFSLSTQLFQERFLISPAGVRKEIEKRNKA